MELTLQQYFEIVQAEGLLFKSLGVDYMQTDSVSNTPPAEIDNVPLQICTADIDRFNDVLNPFGCDYKAFGLNPLFLFEHAKQRPFAESILGSIKSLSIDEAGIKAVARYVPLETNNLPAKIWEMEKKGLIPGNSIGWRPLAGITQRDGKRYVDKWELLEVSKVLLPVNGRATNKQLAQ